jgi:O-antigen/teichoic acid export membrane protein
MEDNTRNTVARNVSVMFAAQSVVWISSFALLMFLPRYLGSEDYGRLYLALSINMILGLLIDFGGNYLIPKEVARNREAGSKIMSSFILLRILLWILAVGVILLLSHLLGYSEHVHLLILILVISKLFDGGGSALSAYFQGIERMEYDSIALIVERVFVAVISIAVLLMGGDSIAMAIIICVGALLNLIVLTLISRKYIRIRFQFDTQIFNLFRPAVPYFLFSLFSVIYYRVDAVMLSAMTNDAVTGWYGGAYRFFDIVMVLPLIYKTAIFPVFSKLWNDTSGYLQHTLGKSLKLILVIGVPASILIFLFAEPIIDFFMGVDEYGPAVIVLKIFSISIPVIFVDLILGSAILGAANRQRAWAVVGFTAIFLNIAANWWLIPLTQDLYMNGGIGAAIATFITEVFMMGAAILLLGRAYLSSFRSSYIFKPALSGVFMILSVWLLGSTGLYWMLVAGAGGMVYIAGLFLLKLFDEKEVQMIRSMLSYSGLKLILSNKNA